MGGVKLQLTNLTANLAIARLLFPFWKTRLYSYKLTVNFIYKNKKTAYKSKIYKPFFT